MAESFFKTREGVSLWYHYMPTGEGAPLVMCDGLGCDGFIWPHLLAHYAGKRPILRWHYRGHGRSSAPYNLAHLSIQHLADDLAALFNHLNLSPAVLMGHSMGVQVILEFYRHHASRVCALVPMCGSSGRLADSFYGSGRYRPLFDLAIMGIQTLPRITELLWRMAVAHPITPHVAALAEVNGSRMDVSVALRPYFANLERMSIQVFARTLGFAIDHTAEDILPRIHVPTLVVAGGKDGFTPRYCSEQLAARSPNSELLVLPEGTHTAPLEFPDVLARRLDAFLTQPALRAIGRQRA